jgi:uncharacterized protein
MAKAKEKHQINFFKSILKEGKKMNRYLIRKITLFILITLMGISVSQRAWGGYQEGLDAYRRGDYVKALEEFRYLSAQGGALAQYALGQMYRHGKGVPKDIKLAFKWYRKSAEQGNKLAQHILGFIYYKGVGVPRDYNVAVKWFRKSAEQGFAKAQFNLGLMYGRGQGVPKDLVLSYMWFNLSAKSGNDRAKKNRDLVENILSHQKIISAKKLTSEWEEEYKKKLNLEANRANQELQNAGTLTLNLQNLHKQVSVIVNDLSNVDSISQGLLENKISNTFAEKSGIEQLLKIKLKLDSIKKEIDSFPTPSFEKASPYIKNLNLPKKIKIYLDYLPVVHGQAIELYLTTRRLFKSALTGKMKSMSEIRAKQIEQSIVILKSETIIMEKGWKLSRDNKHPQYYMTLCYIYANKAALKLLEFRKALAFGITAQESLIKNISRISVQIDKSVQRGELLATQWGDKYKNSPQKADNKESEFVKSIMGSYQKSFKIERDMVEFLRAMSKHWATLINEDEMSTYSQKMWLAYDVINHERVEEALARTRLLSNLKSFK